MDDTTTSDLVLAARRTWGRRAQSLRVRGGLSLRDVEALARIDYSSLSKIERGLLDTGPGAKLRLAHALDVDVDHLFAFGRSPLDELVERGDREKSGAAA
mgnify:CR=1 FL=1